MSDPLGLVNSGINASDRAGLPGASTQSVKVNASGETFKDALMQNLEKLNEAQQEATAAAEDLATGQRTDVENVLLATQKADQAFRMALALRNKVQAAFDELKQVRI
ncbi:MAG: flagellar hook-basal body complex protein FliE [Phycisphaerales bacterium]|nr:flagellar hook-basal body complex protein FliE [Phycisphaerales bacterium]